MVPFSHHDLIALECLDSKPSLNEQNGRPYRVFGKHECEPQTLSSECIGSRARKAAMAITHHRHHKPPTVLADVGSEIFDLPRS